MQRSASRHAELHISAGDIVAALLLVSVSAEYVNERGYYDRLCLSVC